MNSCTIARKLEVSVVRTVVGARLDALVLFFGFFTGPTVRFGCGMGRTEWDDEPGRVRSDLGVLDRIVSRLGRDGWEWDWGNGLLRKLEEGMESKKVGWKFGEDMGMGLKLLLLMKLDGNDVKL